MARKPISSSSSSAFREEEMIMIDNGVLMEGDEGSKLGPADSGKYVRYSNEQVEVLERIYKECPKPSSLHRQQLIRDNPLLRNIEPKQIKVWFQNRRCREKQRKETGRLQNVNGKLTAMNKLLMEENDRLQKQFSQLLYENSCLRQQMNMGAIATNTSFDAVVNADSLQQRLQAPQHSDNDSIYSVILSLAEETLSEFLSKATGTAIDWIPMPGMKPGPDNTRMVHISHKCSGVAARSCGLVNLDPGTVAEIIKDRPSWQWECRHMQRLYISPTSNGGVLEVLYVQLYAPTTLVPPRDICTLRYTCILEDGSYVICERSLNATQGMPTAPTLHSFVRANMLSSGCLIRPCKGTGSIVIIVDHMDWEPWSVPEVLRPIYDSPFVLAQKQTMAAMHYLHYRAQTPGGAQQQAAAFSVNRRLVRGFNDAVNGFNDNGWCTIESNDNDDVTVAIKTEPTSKDASVHHSSLSGGFLCAKASMLLQNVSPPVLVRYLREHRSEWADLNIESNPVIPSKKNGVTFQSQIFHENDDKDELLELIKIEGCASMSQDMLLLQLCSGIDQNTSGVYAQMVFSPINDSISDEAPFLPSGFHIISLANGSPVGESPKGTLDLASSLDFNVSPISGVRNIGYSNALLDSSVVTMAFQFTFENGREDSMVILARRYVHNIMSTLQRIAIALAPPCVNTSLGSPGSLYGCKEASESTSLDQCLWIVRSYKLNLGTDLIDLSHDAKIEDQEQHLLKALWHLSNAVICCSCKAVPVFTFANEAGLEMLETPSVAALGDLPWEATLDEGAKKSLCALFGQVIMEQGYTYLPGGIRISSKGRVTCFERAVAWRVMDDANNICGIAFMYFNWTFA